ncbi:SixA phosphatase family protein [Pontibacter vulgaris]|uniref:SixA phosphatase family protein n=1 Tax=Pontibacter vulgaris TaxID=2905679 RepID=UPI001FA70442|nr:histidine phosphatase family protein [Pontibacter vulgaris]
MQRLILICRHADAIEPFPLQPDFERELTKEGIQNARNTAQWLRDHFHKVDALIASPARRTSTTATIMANKLYFSEDEIAFEPELYNARETQLVQQLSKLADNIKTVLLVGHNPGVTQLARSLTAKHIAYLEPAQVLAIELDLEKWEEINYTTGIIHSLNTKQIH